MGKGRRRIGDEQVREVGGSGGVREGKKRRQTDRRVAVYADNNSLTLRLSFSLPLISLFLS